MLAKKRDNRKDPLVKNKGVIIVKLSRKNDSRNLDK